MMRKNPATISETLSNRDALSPYRYAFKTPGVPLQILSRTKNDVFLVIR